MSLISERGINLHMYPIIESKGKKLEGDYIIKKNNQVVFAAQEGSRWDLNCYKLMDFLSSKFRDGFVKRCLENYGEIATLQSGHLNHLPLLMKPERIYETDIDAGIGGTYYMTPTISITDISKHISMTGINSWAIKKTIKKASSCFIKTSYHFKSEADMKYTGDMQYNFEKNYTNLPYGHEFQNFFNYEVVEGTTGKDGKTYNYKYKFLFNTPLSYAFIHNLYVGGYSLIDDRVYKLSKYAQILYRMKCLNYDRRQTIQRERTLYELGITNSNITERKKFFKNMISELIGLKMINVIQIDNDKCVLQKDKKEYNKVVKINR